jgi:uncharacterized membrane protein YidH (DUF202 family)
LSQSAARDPRASSLPAERTVLAWTRTSFAFLANGVLLSVKDLHGISLGSLLPAGLAIAAASCSYLIALQRQRTLGRRPGPTQISPRRPVYIVGIAMLTLIVVTAVAQLF